MDRNNKKIMSTSNSFVCKYPFTYVSRSSEGYCKPCCRYKLDKEDYLDGSLRGSIEEAFQGKTFEKIRNKMIKGERLTGCQKCYDEEETGQKSHGRVYTEYFNFTPGVLKGVNIAFSRECNLACRMCHPDYSTKWDSVWRKLHPDKKSIRTKYSHNFKNIVSQKDTFKNVEIFDIVGGEPFINNSFYKFLEQLSHYDLSNKKIGVSTNATFFPKQKYIDTLLQFKELNLGLSVDGINRLGEYIRVYSKWSQVDKVADRWSQLKGNPSVYLYSYTTVSAYNVHDLYNIFKWSLKKKIDFRFHILYEPEYLQIGVLPENIRHRIYTYYLQFPDFQKHLLKLKKHLLKKSSEKTNEFLAFTDKLDRILGQNFFQLNNNFYKRKDLLVG